MTRITGFYEKKGKEDAVGTPHCTMTPGCTNCMTEEKLLFRKILSDRLSTEQGYTQAKSADYLLAGVNLIFFQV